MIRLSGQKNPNRLVFYNILSTVLLNAITLISAPLFSRMLGTENYGIVSVYNSWASVFCVLLSLQTRGTLAISRVTFEEEEYAGYESSAMTLSLVSAFLISAVCIVFKNMIVPFFGLSFVFFVLMLIQSFGQASIEFLNTKLTYSYKAGKNMLITVSLSILSILLSYILLVNWNRDNLYAARILGNTASYGIIGALSLVYVLKTGKTFYNRKYWGFCIPLCVPLIFHNIAGVILASSDRIMLSKMINDHEVGIYVLAYNFANILAAIWSALNNSWNPFFFDYYKQNNWTELKKRSSNYLTVFTCLTLGFLFLSPEVYKIFASKDYWEGLKVIPLIVLGAYTIFLYGLAANYEFAEKRTDIAAIGSAISGICNIILNLFLIRRWGFMGAAFATLIADLILLIIHMILARKLAKEKWIYSMGFFFPAVAAVCAGTAIFYLSGSNWILRWLLAAVTGVYMLLHIWRNKSIF